MHKIYLSILGVLVALGGFFYMLADYRADKIKALEATIQTCEKQKKEVEHAITLQNEAQSRADSTIGEIRTVIKTVKSPCDCYNSRIDDTILERVRGNK